MKLIDGFDPKDAARITEAQEFAASLYLDKTMTTGQSALEFSRTLTLILASLKTDVDTRLAGLLCEIPLISTTSTIDAKALETIELRFGKDVSDLIAGIAQLMRLRTFVVSHQEEVKRSKNAAQQAQMQLETLRKMLLAMASDMRVVLILLASRVATLRYFAQNKAQNEIATAYAQETLDLYAPLANRLGIWQLKWELEDLSFRLIEPATYKHIAQLLEEKRVERLEWIERVMASLKSELAAAEIKAEVSGRPKHIFSIWNKMRGKSLDFSSLYDILAFRIIVADVKTCYAALSVVHHIWDPIEREFDDYIARPKENGYQSLHTVVWAQDQFSNKRALEVQIRTEDMHRFAEYGVAAHWRYKEAGGSNFSEQKYDERIAWLRQLLAWKSDVTDSVIAVEEDQTKDDYRTWGEKLKSGMLDDKIFVLTPQARVIELPAGATAIDFAYHLHTEVGHRCRGARIDGVMVPLNTPLKNGQTLEIITAKGSLGMAGPSRDWLALGYTKSVRARSKIRAWFNAIEQQETLSNGRVLVEKTLQREGKTAVNLEALAHKLGFAKVDALFLSVGKEEFSLRQVEQALHDSLPSKDVLEKSETDAFLLNKGRIPHPKQETKSGVLVVGTDGLMTQLAKCCRPAPPDDIVGFITRGKGVSIHRSNCKNIAEMRTHAGQRMIQTAWGQADLGAVYPVDIFVLASDRQGLLRDISEVFSREKINVTGVHTQSNKGQASMSFIVEIASTSQLQKALNVLLEVAGVQQARRQ